VYERARDGARRRRLLYVIDGKLAVTLGKEKFTLGKGDSAHFDQRHSFQMANAE